MIGYRTLGKKTKGSLVNYEYDLIDIIYSIKDKALEYVWSLSDLQITLYENAVFNKKFDQDPLWLSGEELIIFTQNINNINWGAFLAFHKEDGYFIYDQGKLPYSEGRPPSIQHEKACIEIQAVDGGYFEIFSLDSAVIEILEEKFILEKFII